MAHKQSKLWKTHNIDLRYRTHITVKIASNITIELKPRNFVNCNQWIGLKSKKSSKFSFSIAKNV